MPDERMDELVDRVRDTYHVPPETPREEMWGLIEGRLSEVRGPGGEVIDLGRARALRSGRSRAAGWAVAAAALLVLGIGIGRVSAPNGAPGARSASGPAVVPGGFESALELAAQEHLGRTESLLTMVRADAGVAGLDSTTASWARELLSETRLLLDARGTDDPAVGALLEDLELVLIQIVNVSELGAAGDPRVTTELELALDGLEEGEVLPRIRAVLPPMQAGA